MRFHWSQPAWEASLGGTVFSHLMPQSSVSALVSWLTLPFWIGAGSFGSQAGIVVSSSSSGVAGARQLGSVDTAASRRLPVHGAVPDLVEQSLGRVGGDAVAVSHGLDELGQLGEVLVLQLLELHPGDGGLVRAGLRILREVDVQRRPRTG